LIRALHSLGVKKGDGIGVLSWNCLDYSDVYGAAMKAGFILSPFNPRLQTNEVDYLVRYSEINTLFVGREFVESVGRPGSRFPGCATISVWSPQPPGCIPTRSCCPLIRGGTGCAG